MTGEFPADGPYYDVIHATEDREGMLTCRKIVKPGGFRADQLEYTRKATFPLLAKWLRRTWGARLAASPSTGLG